MALKQLAVVLATAACARASASVSCSFCGSDSSLGSNAHTFDLSSLPSTTFSLDGEVPQKGGLPPRVSAGEFQVTSPCLGADSPKCGPTQNPVLQSCREVGSLVGSNATVVITADGFSLTLAGGFKDKSTLQRKANYRFICDKTVSAGNQPEKLVIEHPGGEYNVVWRTPAACNPSITAAKCAPPPPAPPPAPPPPPCTPGADTCLPSWKPTWHMRNSTVLYTCNVSGMHDVHHANQVRWWCLCQVSR